MEKLIPLMQSIQDEDPDLTCEQQKMEIFIGAYFVKFSHSLEKGSKRARDDRDTEF